MQTIGCQAFANPIYVPFLGIFPLGRTRRLECLNIPAPRVKEQRAVHIYNENSLALLACEGSRIWQAAALELSMAENQAFITGIGGLTHLAKNPLYSTAPPRRIATQQNTCQLCRAILCHLRALTRVNAKSREVTTPNRVTASWAAHLENINLPD